MSQLHLPPGAAFTKEQILIIESLIDAKLAKSRTSAPSAPKDYHTASDIRALIVDNIDKLHDLIGSSEVELGVIRYLLQRLTTLRPGDLLTSQTHENMTRWERQVANVIGKKAARQWPNCPFEEGRRLGVYRLRRGGTLKVGVGFVADPAKAQAAN